MWVGYFRGEAPSNSSLFRASGVFQRGGPLKLPLFLKQMVSKLTTMPDAIARLVHDGASVAIGCALEPLIPFAAGHEIIRQGRSG